MAIPIRRADTFLPMVGPVLTRCFSCLLGLGAVVWGGLELAQFSAQAPLDRIAAEILQGQNFTEPVLLGESRRIVAAKNGSLCNPTVLHDALVIHLGLMNDAIASKDRTRIAAAYEPLDKAIRTSLSCAPADSFAWLILFWLDLSKHGFTPQNSVYLRLSYAFGPNEGWIALRRNRLVIPLFARLPPDLRNQATDEFVKLVDTAALYPETTAIFASAAPAVQGELAAALKSAKPYPRRIFAQALASNGLDVDIPGIDRPPPRPWE